ncbi:type I secretion system permease/ATPase [Terrarubrum flagellatum]|uniref:type I secretion system permease/ATPase n=1 Tax=Terrirubrum flagellatum TaxID=2895980 RepID=UPI0031452501
MENSDGRRPPPDANSSTGETASCQGSSEKRDPLLSLTKRLRDLDAEVRQAATESCLGPTASDPLKAQSRVEEAEQHRTATVVEFEPAAQRARGAARSCEPPSADVKPANDRDANANAANSPMSVAAAESATSPRADATGTALADPAAKGASNDVPALDQRGGRHGGGGSHGGGGRGDGGPPLQKRASDMEFRDVLGRGLASSRRNLITVGVFSIGVNLLVLAIPIFLFQMSDRVLASRSVDTLIMLVAIVVIAIAGHVLLDVMRRVILTRIAVETETKLGAPVLSAAAKAAQTGSSREFQTLADLQQVRAFLTGPTLLTMFDAPVAPVYLLVVYMIHPHLGLILTASGLALIGLAFLNQRVTAMPFTRAMAFGTRANQQAEAMARNAQIINAMGMIPEGVQVWGRETAESLKAQVEGQDLNVLMTGLSKFARLCTQICILGWGAYLAIESQLTGGMIIAASIVGSRALSPLEGTIEGWRSFVHARSAYARVKSLLLSSPLNLDRLRLPRPQGRLTVERILYVPPPNKKVILNGITFQLEPGESLGVVGASGTGKTMLARMLVGSIIPTAGNVRLDMMDLRNWDPRQFGESVGYLPQDVQLFPATIKANIARMRDDALDADVFEAAEAADVHEMISEFAQGYETVISMDGSPLSGGQRQRIGLARAFFGNPRLIVLDEPNANLDARGERALAKALRHAKTKNTTIVAITQRPSLLKSVDKIMILQNGAVQALGKRDDLIPVITGSKPLKGWGGDDRPFTDA